MVAALAGTGSPAQALDQQAPPVPPPHKGEVDVANSVLREAVAESPAPLPGDLTAAGRGEIVVEVLFRDGDAAAAREAITAAGGDPGITVPGELVQADVPLAGLERLEADPAIRYVRPPVDYAEPADAGVERPRLFPGQRVGAFAGEQIQKTNAAAWHAAGITGQGVKVGIIDSFSASHYNAAVNGGEIPQVSGTFCRFNGSNCAASLFSGDRHGIGVAEAVIDMAPSAQIYFASAITAADAQAALNYFDSQGVDVVTRSQTGRYDGPGNGTGPIASVIQTSAVNAGMFYLNSAGNSAGRFGAQGSYWRGGFVDSDLDGFVEFSPGDELMGFDCSFINGLRWSDWGQGAGTTDYDFYLYNSTPAVIESSEDSQGSSGGTAPPIERIDSFPCPAGGFAQMAIFRFNAGSGTAGDVLEIMTNGAGVEHPQNPFSASGPMADLNSPGAVAVGAVDPALGTTIADYSSEGPTNDLRVKPDLSAAACVKSLSYAPGCFNGTSSSTPVTAGAAALVLSSGAANSPQTVKSYLLNATVDRGVAGTDNIYGRGELRLPAPPQVGDNDPPNVRALRSKGKSGKKAKLKYRTSDDSGETRERLQVVRRGKVIEDITTRFGPATGKTYFVVWKVPKRVKGKMKFCVVSQDRAGNNSASSCAKLKIKKKKKRHRR
ncbi:MAG TPA: S8 family serine peptidase [Solirubrobacterales bacterium]|nr:S8 family serine peptidase [Solirubrobacterales bacterium]